MFAKSITFNAEIAFRKINKSYEENIKQTI